MPDASYWADRAMQLEAAAHARADESMDIITDAYRRAAKDLESQISTWYGRFAQNNGIVDMAEARRLLNGKELKEFRWTVNDYIKHGRENGITADWSKQLENASARWHISRLESLNVQMRNTVETLYGKQAEELDRLVRETYAEGYMHTAFEIQRGIGIGWDVASVPESVITKLVGRPWTVDGRNFSERIWADKTVLVNELQRALTQHFLTGGRLQDVVKWIRDKMGTSENKAARLVYTENAYFQSVAQRDSFRELGVKMYVFVATLDERTSDICRSLDGQKFEMRDFAPGVNAPPMHPWCRSATAPYYADLEGIGQRAARDADGNTYTVPRGMTYAEWEKTFVKDE